MICTSTHQIFQLFIKEGEMGRACGKYEEEEKSTPGFGGET